MQIFDKYNIFQKLTVEVNMMWLRYGFCLLSNAPIVLKTRIFFPTRRFKIIAQYIMIQKTVNYKQNQYALSKCEIKMLEQLKKCKFTKFDPSRYTCGCKYKRTVYSLAVKSVVYNTILFFFYLRIHFIIKNKMYEFLYAVLFTSFVGSFLINKFSEKLCHIKITNPVVYREMSFRHITQFHEAL